MYRAHIFDVCSFLKTDATMKSESSAADRPIKPLPPEDASYGVMRLLHDADSAAVEAAAANNECYLCSYQAPSADELESHVLNMHGCQYTSPKKQPPASGSSAASTPIAPRSIPALSESSPSHASMSPAPSRKTAGAHSKCANDDSAWSSGLNGDTDRGGDVTTKNCRYRCSLCDHTSLKRSAIWEHVITQHFTYRPYQCPMCYVSSTSRSHVLTHMRGVHHMQQTVIYRPDRDVERQIGRRILCEERMTSSPRRKLPTSKAPVTARKFSLRVGQRGDAAGRDGADEDQPNAGRTEVCARKDLQAARVQRQVRLSRGE